MKVLKLEVRLVAVLAVLALVAALGGVAGAGAAGVLIGSKQIKNGSVKSIDLSNGGVQSADLQNEGVKSTDLKNDGVQSPDLAPNSVEGEAIAPASVEGEALALPVPVQCQVAGSSAITPTLEFQKVADLCSYDKAEAGSALEVSWTGSVLGENGGQLSGCVFQVRVNDQAPGQGGGEMFGKGLAPASVSAIFAGVGTGHLVVSVWAKMTVDTPAGDHCEVGPPAAGVSQTVTVAEAVS